MSEDTVEKSQDYLLLQKVFDMINYAYPALQQYPKSEKFSLVQDIKLEMNEMLRLTIAARKKYFKKTTLQDLDIHIATLKAFVRLSFDLKFLPMRKYEIWSGKIVEIGKMVGGWIKTVNEKAAQS